jgi:hypothetical protein
MTRPKCLPDRRAFLGTAAAFGLALPLTGLAGLAGMAAGPAAGPRIERLGSLYLVDGWVLTRDDVARIFPDAP